MSDTPTTPEPINLDLSLVNKACEMRAGAVNEAAEKLCDSLDRCEAIAAMVGQLGMEGGKERVEIVGTHLFESMRVIEDSVQSCREQLQELQTMYGDSGQFTLAAINAFVKANHLRTAADGAAS